MASPSFPQPCCLTTKSIWPGTPTGRISTLANHDVYIAGANPKSAVLYITDLLGWSLPNARLLADAYAAQANVTVYVPDFFQGEVLPFEPIFSGRWDEVDIPGFIERHSREKRDKEMFDCARALREEHGYAKVGAIAFCYGSWGVLRLLGEKGLLDCGVIGHPSLTTKEDYDAVVTPLMVLAPEIDPIFTPELKAHCFAAMTGISGDQGRGKVPFEYIHLPGVEHNCLVRGDDKIAGDREAQTLGIAKAVYWFKRFLDTSA